MVDSTQPNPSHNLGFILNTLFFFFFPDQILSTNVTGKFFLFCSIILVVKYDLGFRFWLSPQTLLVSFLFCSIILVVKYDLGFRLGVFHVTGKFFILFYNFGC